MNLQGTASLVIMPIEEYNNLRATQQEILQKINELKEGGSGTIPVKYITAKEFMTAVRICRSKFDQLVSQNKIRSIKKRRKIYVPISEIDRYFSDSST